MERALAETTSDSEQSAPRLPRRWFPGKEQQPENQPGSGSTSRGEKPKRLGFWLRLLRSCSWSTCSFTVRCCQRSSRGALVASHFTTYVPATGDPNLLPLLEQKGVEVRAQPVQPPWWQTALEVLINLLPVLLLLYFSVMSWRGMRQMQDLQGGGLFGIGRNRARLYSEERPTTTFADVAGVDEAKLELREVIDFLRDPGRFLTIGAHIPKGVLLVGPPGTGKTLLARAVAGEAGVPFFSCSATDFVELFVGVGASRVWDLFAQARKHAPCIIFIEHCTVGGGVPTMLLAMVQHPDVDRYDLSSLKLVLCGGAPVPVALMEQVHARIGADVSIVYAQTESSCTMTQTLPDDPFERKVATVGVPLPHTEIKVIDPATGKTVPCGQRGEICTRGYLVMQGYYQMPEKSAQAIDRDGWLHTGDLATMHTSGHVNIVGRLKDMVIRGGENLFPAEMGS